MSLFHILHNIPLDKKILNLVSNQNTYNRGETYQGKGLLPDLAKVQLPKGFTILQHMGMKMYYQISITKTIMDVKHRFTFLVGTDNIMDQNSFNVTEFS